MTTFRVQWQGASGQWLWLDRIAEGRDRGPIETVDLTRARWLARDTADVLGTRCRLVLRRTGRGRWSEPQLVPFDHVGERSRRTEHRIADKRFTDFVTKVSGRIHGYSGRDGIYLCVESDHDRHEVMRLSNKLGLPRPTVDDTGPRPAYYWPNIRWPSTLTETEADQ